MKRISLNKIHLLSLCFFLGTVITLAQTQNVEWSAESFLVTANGTDVEVTSNLSKQGAVFTWEQVGYNTSDISTFTITSATGTWNAQDNVGELNYELTSDDSSTNLTVTGTAEGITMLLIVTDTNTSISDSYIFHIETLTNL